MDNEKTGKLILKLRKEKQMTQSELADVLGVSDKAVSKWERGQGIPDVSLLVALSEFFKINIDDILAGETAEKMPETGNMKNLKFYVCPSCGNITVCTGSAEISCCGRRLELLEMKKPDAEHDVKVEVIEDEWYITSEHPMQKDHHLLFAAFMTGDRLQMIKQYPEWDMQVRIRKQGHGKLVWCCNKHGLFYKLI